MKGHCSAKEAQSFISPHRFAACSVPYCCKPVGTCGTAVGLGCKPSPATANLPCGINTFYQYGSSSNLHTFKCKYVHSSVKVILYHDMSDVLRVCWLSPATLLLPEYCFSNIVLVAFCCPQPASTPLADVHLSAVARHHPPGQARPARPTMAAPTIPSCQTRPSLRA